MIPPLTPNLKFSDPLNMNRLYDEKHVFKRSNSQNEFDFLNGNFLDQGLNDFGFKPNNFDNDFFNSNDHGLQFDKPFGAQERPLPFSHLAAGGSSFQGGSQ